MTAKQRLDQLLVHRGQVASRSQAESYIKLGYVTVNGAVITKPGAFVSENDRIKLTVDEQYVSRAALKLASVPDKLGLNFKDKVVLDVGSSTGGFTDYALRHGARKVVAVEAGTEQLHPSLRNNPKIELHEQTDIRELRLWNNEHAIDQAADTPKSKMKILNSAPDIVLIDVSFISLTDILPHISRLVSHDSMVVAMAKPQFEAGKSSLKHKGVIKNDKLRREVLKQLENWVQDLFIIVDKADSEVAGSKGNRERFYLLQKLGQPSPQQP
jgi:23S rRNA (cytidine1920-2'-O)/16S rRNA (cytidine1409-2'-O)-methyltransferase